MNNPHITYAAIKLSPSAIQEAIKQWVDDGHGSPYIRDQLTTEFNYRPAIAAIGNYIKKYREQKAARDDSKKVMIARVTEKNSDLLEAVRSEIKVVNALVDKVPSTSERVKVLKSLINKCVDRIIVLENEPVTPQNESVMVRYIGEIRDNIALLTKFSEKDLSEDVLSDAVAAEFGNVLAIVKDIIAEECPEHLPAIAAKLKLRLESNGS